MTENEVHPYFVDKAREVFVRAGGDPDRAGNLAAWAQAAKKGADGGDTRRRVVVAETGEILAEARHVRSRVSASYVTAVTHVDDRDLIRRELGLSVGSLRRRHGPAIVVTFSEVCLGPGKSQAIESERQ